MTHASIQTPTLFPIELKRSGFQQFNWKLVGYGLLAYIKMVLFVVYFSSQPLPDVNVNPLYTPIWASQAKPPAVGIQFPPTDLKPEANNSAPNITDQGTPVSTPVVQSSDGVSGQTDRPVRVRRNRTSVKDIQNLGATATDNGWAELSISGQSGTGAPSMATAMAHGNLEGKLKSVETIRRADSNGSGITSQTDGTGTGFTDDMGFTRSDVGMVGESKQAPTDLNGLTMSGPGRIGTQNGQLSGKVEIDKASFTTTENTGLRGRSEGDILRVLNSKMSALRFQFQHALKLNPGLEGVLKVRLSIDTNGRVSQVEIMEDTLNNHRFVSRITSIMRTWLFGAVNTVQSTAILTFPFTSNCQAGEQHVDSSEFRADSSEYKR